MKKIYYILGIAGILLGIGFLLFNKPNDIMAGLANSAKDLIGTRVATTTTGVAFYGANVASTTYPVLIGDQVDMATFTLKATGASTTAQGPNVFLSILESNDSQCDTATTTTTMADTVIVNEINWFDASSHILNLAGSSTILPTATTTIKWLPVVGQGVEITLTDLSARCLALRVSASSTILYSQIRTKSY